MSIRRRTTLQLRYLRFSQRYCWSLKYSETWSRAAERVVTDVSNDCVAFFSGERCPRKTLELLNWVQPASTGFNWGSFIKYLLINSDFGWLGQEGRFIYMKTCLKTYMKIYLRTCLKTCEDIHKGSHEDIHEEIHEDLTWSSTWRHTYKFTWRRT
jgi:hypothetical protein